MEAKVFELRRLSGATTMGSSIRLMMLLRMEMELGMESRDSESWQGEQKEESHHFSWSSGCVRST